MDPDEVGDLMASFVSSDIGDGTPVEFSRIVDPTVRPPLRVSASCDAAVHNYTARELGNGILQGDTNLVLEGDALTGLLTAFGSPPGPGYEVKYAGFRRQVVSSSPTLIANIIVRIDVLVRG
jgi:hypothetical protein